MVFRADVHPRTDAIAYVVVEVELSLLQNSVAGVEHTSAHKLSIYLNHYHKSHLEENYEAAELTSPSWAAFEENFLNFDPKLLLQIVFGDLEQNHGWGYTEVLRE